MWLKFWADLKADTPTLGFLLAVLTAVGGAVWALYLRRHSESEPVSTTTVVNQGITLDEYERAIKRKESEIRAELNATSTSDPARRELLEGQLQQAQERAKNLESEFESYKAKMAAVAKEYDDLKREVVPSNVTPDVLPAGLKVKEFVPNDHLSLKITGLRARDVIFRAVFGVVWVGGITFILFLTRRHFIAGGIFFVLVYSLLFTQCRITFDFKKKKVRVYLPGAYAKFDPLPVLVKTQSKKDGWVATVNFGTIPFAKFPPQPTEKEARLNVLPFARAINWKMGIPLLISDDAESPTPKI